MPLLRLIAVPGTRPRRGRRRHVAEGAAPQLMLHAGTVLPLAAVLAQAEPPSLADEHDALPAHARSWGPPRPL